MTSWQLLGCLGANGVNNTLSLSGGDRHTDAASSEEDSDSASVPSNEERKVNRRANRIL